MTTTERLALALALSVAGAAASGCGAPTGDDVDRVGLRAGASLPARAGTVLVDGCVLDAWQRATLASPSARRVLQTVVMLCLVPRDGGVVGPRDASALAALGSLTTDLHAQGYRVSLGVAFTDETGQRYDGEQTRAWISDPAFRATFVTTLADTLTRVGVDGVELDLEKLPPGARDAVTALATETSAAVRPGKALGVFVPPSVTDPSDLPDGEAFARKDLAKVVDRMRVMTLDYSDNGPGPTIDPGWAVDAARLALGDARAVDVAYPLYGTDFGPAGATRSVTYLEAIGLASLHQASIERGPTGAPVVRWADGAGAHETWFDDADSTARALGAWTYDALPAEVGVLYYGLGAEDPALWDALAARLP